MEKICRNCKFWSRTGDGIISKCSIRFIDIDKKWPLSCGYLYSCDKHSGLDNNDLKEEDNG